jgi:hypothetical protein
MVQPALFRHHGGRGDSRRFVRGRPPELVPGAVLVPPLAATLLISAMKVWGYQ